MNLKNIFKTVSKLQKDEDEVFKRVENCEIDFGEEAVRVSSRYYSKLEVRRYVSSLFSSTLSSHDSDRLKGVLVGGDPWLRAGVFSNIVKEFCDLLSSRNRDDVFSYFGDGDKVSGEVLCEVGRCFIDDVIRVEKERSEGGAYALAADFPSEEVLEYWKEVREEFFFYAAPSFC